MGFTNLSKKNLKKQIGRGSNLGIFGRDDKLTANDLKNILLWYERMISSSNEGTISDNRTRIKIQAMLIYNEESDEELSNHRKKWGR